MQTASKRWWNSRWCAPGGPGRTERWAAIDLRARAISGLAVMLATTAAWLYELAEGRDGSPYGQLLAVGGVAYIGAIVFLRRRNRPA
jgi:hypothetical protein